MPSRLSRFKVKKLKSLRERYEALKYQAVLDGINIEEIEKNIDTEETKATTEAATEATEVTVEVAVETAANLI